MYHRLIEEYLTEYQPSLKAKLIECKQLDIHLHEQNEAMTRFRNHLITKSLAKDPELSQTQRELEADEAVRAIFLPVTETS